ncbi:HESO1 [Scenedesmus sp. PABB004]|nr:HESO1 [Scenedesmus sp. PABB004]
MSAAAAAALAAAVGALADDLTPSAAERGHRAAALAQHVRQLSSALQAPEGAQVVLSPFGSSLSGLALAGSDIDLGVFGSIGGRPLRECPARQQQAVLRAVLRAITDARLAAFREGGPRVQALWGARVPVLKYTCRLSGLEVDASLQETGALLKAGVLRAVAERACPALAPLYRLAKSWAAAHDLNDASRATVNSTALLYMVLFFLQRRSLAPPLRALIDDALLSDRGARPLAGGNVALCDDDARRGALLAAAERAAARWAADRARAGAPRPPLWELLVSFWETWSGDLADCVLGRKLGLVASLWVGDWAPGGFAKPYTFAIEDPFDDADCPARAVGTLDNFNRGTPALICHVFGASARAAARFLGRGAPPPAPAALRGELRALLAWLFGPRAVLVRGRGGPPRLAWAAAPFADEHEWHLVAEVGRRLSQGEPAGALTAWLVDHLRGGEALDEEASIICLDQLTVLVPPRRGAAGAADGRRAAPPPRPPQQQQLPAQQEWQPKRQPLELQAQQAQQAQQLMQQRQQLAAQPPPEQPPPGQPPAEQPPPGEQPPPEQPPPEQPPPAQPHPEQPPSQQQLPQAQEQRGRAADGRGRRQSNDGRGPGAQAPLGAEAADGQHAEAAQQPSQTRNKRRGRGQGKGAAAQPEALAPQQQAPQQQAQAEAVSQPLDGPALQAPDGELLRLRQVLASELAQLTHKRDAVAEAPAPKRLPRPVKQAGQRCVQAVIARLQALEALEQRQHGLTAVLAQHGITPLLEAWRLADGGVVWEGLLLPPERRQDRGSAAGLDAGVAALALRDGQSSGAAGAAGGGAMQPRGPPPPPAAASPVSPAAAAAAALAAASPGAAAAVAAARQCALAVNAQRLETDLKKTRARIEELELALQAEAAVIADLRAQEARLEADGGAAGTEGGGGASAEGGGAEGGGAEGGGGEAAQPGGEAAQPGPPPAGAPPPAAGTELGELRRKLADLEARLRGGHLALRSCKAKLRELECEAVEAGGGAAAVELPAP